MPSASEFVMLARPPDPALDRPPSLETASPLHAGTMTHPLSPAALFELSAFAHRALFEHAAYAWEALAGLSSYVAEHVHHDLSGAKVEEGALLFGPILAGEGTVIEAGAYVRGPAIFGPDCQIRSGAYVRGGVVTGAGCVIGGSSELKNTILLDHANAPHHNYCGDSILGNHVNLGSGTKLANVKLGPGNVRVRHEGEALDTGLRKLGAILGDGTKTGCNSVTNPGTISGRDARIFPVVNVGPGFLAPGSVNRGR